jgi:hypothetical protein
MPENPLSRAAQALLAGTRDEVVASWSFDVATDTWTWSAEVFAMLGFRPGDVVPTSEMLHAHRDGDTGDGAPADLAALQDGRPFARQLAVRDAANRPRSLLAVGQAVRDGAGEVVEVRGTFVDLTAWRRDNSAADVREGIAAATSSREVIDQAKGALMALYGVTADEAFEALVQRSQRVNVKVRELARLLVRRLGDPARRAPADGEHHELLAELVDRT